MAKKVKSISFNSNNENENAILKFIGRRNFSKYVKGLIRKDMDERKKRDFEPLPVIEEVIKEEEVKPLSVSEEIEKMRQQRRVHQVQPAPPKVLINLPKHR